MNLLASTSKLFFHAQEDQIAITNMTAISHKPYSFKQTNILRIQERTAVVPINAIRVGFIGNEEALVAVDDEGFVGVWFIDKLDCNPIILKNGNISSWGIAMSSFHRTLAISGNDHAISLFNLLDNSVNHLCGHQHNIPSLDFSKCGKYLGSASVDGTLRIWDISTLQQVQIRKFNNDWFENCLFKGLVVCEAKDGLNSESPSDEDSHFHPTIGMATDFADDEFQSDFPDDSTNWPDDEDEALQQIRYLFESDSENDENDEKRLKMSEDAGSIGCSLSDYLEGCSATDSETYSISIREISDEDDSFFEPRFLKTDGSLKYSEAIPSSSSNAKELVLFTTNNHLFLLDKNDLLNPIPLAFLPNVIFNACSQSLRNSYNVMIFQGFDRLLYHSWIPELSCFIVGSQTGFLACVRLMSQNGKYRFALEKTLPLGAPPLFPLMGFFVQKINGDDLFLMHFVVFLLYLDGSVVCFKLFRKLQSEDLYFVQL